MKLKRNQFKLADRFNQRFKFGKKFFKKNFFEEMAKRSSQQQTGPSDAPPLHVTMSPRQQFASHAPRLLNSQGEPLEDTVSRTARIPPPKIVPSVVRRADSFTDAQQPQVNYKSWYVFLTLNLLLMMFYSLIFLYVKYQLNCECSSALRQILFIKKSSVNHKFEGFFLLCKK